MPGLHTDYPGIFRNGEEKKSVEAMQILREVYSFSKASSSDSERYSKAELFSLDEDSPISVIPDTPNKKKNKLIINLPIKMEIQLNKDVSDPYLLSQCH